MREYGVIDGLPQSQVYSIFQDSRGYLWIITRNGLSRYDGIEFVNYFKNDGLPSNSASFVMEDSGGIVWVVSREGISRYNGSGFEYFPPQENFKSLTYVKAIDYNGNLLVSAFAPSSRVGRIYLFREGVYSDFSREFPALDSLELTHFESGKNTNEFYIVDNEGSIYSWNNNKLTEISTRKYEDFHFVRNEILAVISDTILTYNGISFRMQEPYSFRSGPEARFRNDRSRSYLEYFDGRFVTNLFLPFSPIGCFLDVEDVLWIKSENNMFRLLSTSFFGFSDDEIGAMNLWAIAEDCNGHIWFGSLYGTLIEYDGKKFTEREEFKSLFSSEPSFYKGSRKMSDGDIWFSTNMGVLIWNGTKFSRLRSIPDSSQVCYIYEDPVDKSVLVGTGNGLFIIKGDSVRHYGNFNDSELGVIEGIIRLDNDRYLLSGHNGLVEFNGINSTPLKEEILPEVYTYTLEKDRFGGIWVTSEEGLYLRRKSSEKFIHGLPESINIAANSIYLMDSTRVLVGRGTDICVIDLQKFYAGEKEYFRIFDKSDGFGGSDCIDNGIIKDRLGRFWILTSNNVVRFDPSRLKINTVPPRLHFTGLYFQNDSLDWEPVDRSNFFFKIPDVIKLYSWQNKIQITFTGISTTNPEKALMSYRLTGLEDKWSYPSSKRNVIYEKLPPGNYQFELKAANADGIETQEPLAMSIRVMPTIWQTLLFKILYVLISVSLTITLTTIFLAWRQRKKADEERLRSELSNLQMISVLSQFDPHFTFNVISSVGSLIMKGEKEIAYDYITKLSGLLRTVLSDGSFIIRPLADELDFVRRYCELQKLRFKERFNFQINVDQQVDLQRKIPKMTIQTFVENAIKHGFDNRKEGGTIIVTVRCIENNLEILIADDGIGRIEASKNITGGTGNGIKLVSGLLEMMNSKNPTNAELEITDLIKNGKSSGTEVRIFIPNGYSFEFT